MRSSTKALLALNFSLAAAGACDDGPAADDVGGWADEPVAFRECLPPECPTNSPFVGDYPFSNIRTKQTSPANTPIDGVVASSAWGSGYFQRADNTWVTFNFLVPTEEGRLYAYNSATNTRDYIDQGQQAFFTITITDSSVSPTTVKTYQMWIKDVTTASPTPSFTAWKYTIATKAPPLTVDFPSVGSPSSLPPALPPTPWGGTYYSICPVSDDENGEALILQSAKLVADGDAAWLENGYGWGPENAEVSSHAVIACQGQAFSKPQEILGVAPNSYDSTAHYGARRYGLANYNALVNAYRAFYAGEPRTLLGTLVFFKDFAHSPPWFDQTTSAYLPSTPPPSGSWQFVLESVYKDVRFARQSARRQLLLHQRQLPGRRASPVRPARRQRQPPRVGQHAELRRHPEHLGRLRPGRRLRAQEHPRRRLLASTRRLAPGPDRARKRSRGVRGRDCPDPRLSVTASV
ncbi:hypothetical protein [Nannocystis pusilla]|uniref:hypothetical protein n=1 Tax=Nannocystis pusilla TaxID=889268 RepID=UPI003DA50101